MNRQDRTDAQNLFTNALNRNKGQMQKIVNRLGVENLIEISAISYLLYFELKAGFAKELKDRIEERIQKIREEEKLQDNNQ